uniref:Synaptobrevin, longin-like domain protein n=1 Tax=Tanacetum cinerariifolium TaxID=118510 RepID=A0A699HJE1_TANCI|nr:synaptobrevin, longin-like domain protein [Tanacetum cinerariifolium]
MIAYLTKSDASEGFNQIIDFLNASSIKYALTVNPNIYVSYIKQFWTSVVVKKVNDITRLQALVDKKKVIITKATIRDALRLDDAEGIDCLPNEEIFTELARMGYEKPSTKLTFYKVFFLPQWKFLIHTILQCMSAKRTLWNEFSSSMASAVICLSTGRKFNFSKYIFDSLVRNVDSSTKFYMYPRFLQWMIRAQVGDLSSHSTKYSSHALTQKVFANMRMVGKGFSGIDTLLFEGMIVAQQVGEGADEVHVKDVPAAGVADEGAASVADDDVPAAIDEPSIPSPTLPTQPPPPSQDQPSTSQDADISMDLLQNLLDTCTTLKRRVEHLEHDKITQALEITKLKQRVKKLERMNKLKVLKLRRLKRVGTTQRIETFDDTVMDDVPKQGRMITDMDADVDVTLKDIAKDVAVDAEIEEYRYDEVEPVELQEVMKVVTTAKLITEVVTADSTTITVTAPQLTNAATPTLTTAPSAARRRKRVVIRDHEKTTTPSIIIYTEPKSKDKGKGIMKEDNAVKRYQALKRKPQTEAQARKNMMIYLRNTKEQMDEEESRALKRLSESHEDKAAKKQNLDEENFSDDFLLTTLGAMVEKPDVQAQIWKNQRSVHGQAKIKIELQYNLAYFFVKSIKSARATPKAHLPYGMFLTRLFRHVMEHHPHLDNGVYDVVERAMRPLALTQARQPRSDREKARHFISSTSAHHSCGSLSRQEDDDKDDGASRASAPSPTTYLNSFKPLNYQQYEIPSPSEQSDDLLFKRQTELLNQS